MQVLAIMAAEIIAKTRKISKQKAYSRFMVSKTGEMLFDESTDLWMNGPDYIVDEYKREMKNRRRNGTTALNKKFPRLPCVQACTLLQ